MGVEDAAPRESPAIRTQIPFVSACSERKSSWPVVYIGGFKRDSEALAWYCLDVESLRTTVDGKAPGGYVSVRGKSKKRKVVFQFSTRSRPLCRWVSVKKIRSHRVKLPTAAEISKGLLGGCTIIGEDLYWFGQILHRCPGRNDSSMDLVKHDINDAKPCSWEPLFSSSKVPSFHIALFPVGRKIYVLSGIDRELNLCGQIYDLDCNKWVNLKFDIYKLYFGYRFTAPYVALLENKDGESTEIMFYSLAEGSVVFFDLASSKLLRKDENHAPLAVWKHLYSSTRPLGLEACVNIANLIDATHYGPGLLSNNTLYWFTRDLHLYGYDIELKRWVQSPFLGEQLPTLTPFNEVVSRYPFLVDLLNGKFLLIVPERRGELTVAPFSVSRDGDCLSVTVESFHPLSLDDTSFMHVPAMSTLKNTRSGTMRGPGISATKT